VKKALGFLFLVFLCGSTSYGAETCSSTSSRPQGELPTCIAIDAATTDTTSATINTYGYPYLSLSVKVAEASSTARINIQCKEYTDDQWHECAEDIVDPDNTDRSDQAVNLSSASYYRITTTGHVAGTITIYFTRGRS
jgi:hypothetical protein